MRIHVKYLLPKWMPDCDNGLFLPQLLLLSCSN
jgi:hypothetical protein